MAVRINGKRFDKDTAKYIGEYNNGKSMESEDYIIERLYCKITGDYFLYCIGGENTIYKENSSHSDSKKHYIPLSYEEAEFWAKAKLSDEEFDKYFNFNDISDDDKVQVSIYIKRRNFKKLKEISQKKKLHYGEYFDEILENEK